MAVIKSRRTTYVLLLLLAAVYYLGQVIPQRGAVGEDVYLEWKNAWPGLAPALEAAGFTDIYVSVFVLALIIFLFTNLIAATASRLRPLLEGLEPQEPSAVGPGAAPLATVELGEGAGPEEVIERVKGELGGYRVRHRDGMFWADRFASASLGPLVVNMAVILVMAGGLLYFYTRSAGTVVLTEGQPLTDRTVSYRELKGPIIGEPPLVGFVVDKIRLPQGVWEQGKLEADLDIRLSDGRIAKGTVGTGAKRSGDVKIRIKEVGVAPAIVLREPGGLLYESAYITLFVLYGTEDSYSFPSTSYMAKFRLYPDYFKGKFGDSTRSLQMKNPVFRVEFYKAKKLIKDELMKPGDETLVDGLLFSIDDIRLWGEFVVTKGRGMTAAMSGLAMLAAGYLWQFIFYRRQIRGQIIGRKLYLTGQSGYFHGQNEKRVNLLAERIRHRLRS